MSTSVEPNKGGLVNLQLIFYWMFPQLSYISCRPLSQARRHTFIQGQLREMINRRFTTPPPFWWPQQCHLAQVTLHLYDLSKGMASVLAPILLQEQLEAAFGASFCGHVVARSGSGSFPRGTKRFGLVRPVRFGFLFLTGIWISEALTQADSGDVASIDTSIS